MRRAAEGIGRREALGVLGALGVTAWLGCGGGSDASDPTSTPAPTSTPSATPTPADLSCVVTPAQTEGPYFVEERLERSNLTGDTSNPAVLNGLPLRLELGVYRVEGASCTPLSGAQVDLWHADAAGTYSDVLGAVGETFLRGYQVADEDGAVSFTTIYPGWYPGRTAHLHFKIRFFSAAGDTTFEFTSQLYFDDAVTDVVFAAPPYDSRGDRDTTNRADAIYADGGDELLLTVAPASDGAGYVARFTIGLRTS
jgi:protocatechuate 3,4-dioxygenase beta subunit